MDYNKNNILYTCDINPVPKLADNHVVITKNALELTKNDLDNQTLDLIFFDCHDMVQMDIYKNFVDDNIINDNTIIALHYPPYNLWGKYIKEEDGYAHQPVERQMVNIFKTLGYDIFSISTDSTKHNDNFPFRHGITICRKFKMLIE